MNSTSGGINAMVLAGGKSRRLGRDKVCESVGGQSMLARTAALAGRFCRQVWVSGRDPATLGLDLPWMPDDEPGLGPMGGIVTCLRRLGTPLLVLACDLPLLREDVVRALLTAREERPAAAVMTTFLQQETGFIESLVAVYEPEALPLLKAAAGRRELKLSQAVPPERRHHIPYGPERAEVFFNVNYPADLQRLRRLERA
jgi:molybdopterin-guanine dinucleotide biosynthesis protein A